MLAPHEVELRGSWLVQNGRMVEDATSQRIWALVRSALTLISIPPDGWNKIYRDDQDGRMWELSFPNGGMQGGGPPLLRLVDSHQTG